MATGGELLNNIKTGKKLLTDAEIAKLKSSFLSDNEYDFLDVVAWARNVQANYILLKMILNFDTVKVGIEDKKITFYIDN